MKVLEPGNGQTEWSQEFICSGIGNGGGGCGAKLLVGKSDLYITTRRDYLGDVDRYVKFRCSVCHVETTVSDKYRRHVPDETFKAGRRVVHT